LEYSEERIFPIPSLPDEITNSVNRHKLAVFIGAGASRLIGCMGWSQLADKIVDACFDEKCIKYKEKNALGKKNPKKKISICQHVLDRHKKADVFFEIIRKSLQADPKKAEMLPIYQELYKLRAVYVTTNVDEYFDNLYFKDSIVYKTHDFDANNIDPTRLYHLHGTISDPQSMIFTTRRYLEHYRDPNILSFLKKLFSEYTVLFIEYGMEEFEVIDFLFTKTTGSSGVLRHFVLLPMFRGEENILTFEEYYYGDLGIEVIPYAIDDSGREQLYYVIENWQKEINLSSTFLHDSFERIEKNIDHYDPETAQGILQLIKNDPPLENHFFRKLISIEWLLPLRDAGYFDPDRNPKPQPTEKEGYCTIPHWNVIGYLIKVSEQITEETDAKYAQGLMEIVRAISIYRTENEKSIDNYRTNWAFIKVMANLPTTFVEIEDIDLIHGFLDSGFDTSLVASELAKSLLPKLLRHGEKEKALRLVEIVTSVKWADQNGGRPVPLMDEYWLNELFEKTKKDISILCPLEAAHTITRKMEEIISKKPNEFSVAFIPTIDDHPENIFQNRFQNAFVRMVRDLLKAALNVNKESATSTLDGLLKRDHSIFKRLSLSLIDENWHACSGLFHSFLSRGLFLDYSLRHEVYTLLKRHYNSFSSELKDVIVKWIEEGPDWKPREDNKEQYELEVAIWKQDWLSALLPSSYEPAIELYERYKKITKAEPEHPDLFARAEVSFGSVSPLEVPELLEKTNEEIADYLKNFKEEKGWKKPTKEGLGNALYEAIKSAPSKFDGNLKPFLQVPLNYQYNIAQGFCDAWKENKTLRWYDVLDYCEKIICSEQLWKDESSYRREVVSQIANLLIEGTRDDSHAFAKDHLPVAENVILTMLEKTGSDLRYPEDIVTATLNSAKGRVIAALVNYALRVARLNYDKDAQVRWSEKIKEEFTNRLDRNVEPSLEWSVCIGEYLPNLYYLDKSWVEENINIMFPKENEDHWQAAMQGYLIVARLYDSLYDLLKKNSHYQKAMVTEFKSEDSNKRLVDHLCIAYLKGKESLTDEKSLFLQCLNVWKPSDILEIISFFWMQRKYLVGENGAKSPELMKLKTIQRKKILDFWGHAFNVLKDKPSYSEGEKKILSNISQLVCFIERIDEEKLPWLNLAARFMEHMNSIFFVEQLDRLSDSSPREVGNVYLTMLGYVIPDYKIDHIRSLVDKLYQFGEKDSADRISNVYFSKGFEFLRDIYETNKKS
jgi:hypothetical protein